MANCYDSLGDMKKAYESLVKAQELIPKILVSITIWEYYIQKWKY